MKPNNLVIIIFDSCRFDSFIAAKTPNISRLGKVEKCYSFASWTFPSHAVYLMGAMPHTNQRGVYASEIYKKDFLRWQSRLNIEGVSFGSFVPQLSLPALLTEKGYTTNGLVSMPVLNQMTVMSQNFHNYELMDSHNDFSAIIDKMQFNPYKPSFYFINVGETHYPYNLPGEEMADYVKGDKTVFRHSGDSVQALNADTEKGLEISDSVFFMDKMRELQNKQISNVEYLDKLFEKLYQKVPQNTHIIVTADHGELFGEEGFFGHGPIMHEKVNEVFLIEGLRP